MARFKQNDKIKIKSLSLIYNKNLYNSFLEAEENLQKKEKEKEKEI